ncbi:MAG: protein kinase [Bacteroidetes bacterium]|nr:protein kinase [Bacteroidota bacterium]
MPTLQPNHKFANRYLLKKLLGIGGYSQVWLAEDTKSGNLEVAVKIFAPGQGMDDKGLELFSKEYALVFNLNHPGLLKPTHFDDFEGSPYLVMQYCHQGSVFGKIGEMSEKELARFMLQSASALNYLHSQEPPIIHQDIKPDNFLIDANGNYLLADFGISSKIRRTLTKSMGSQASTGTLAYMPPEKFSADKQIIKAGDIFSLGVTMYELLTGDLPFGDHGGMVMLTGAQVPNLPSSFNPELNTLLKRCMAKEPWERPTAEQLEVTAIKFLQTGQWPTVGKDAPVAAPEPPQEPEKPRGGRKTEPIPQPQPESQSESKFETESEPESESEPENNRNFTPWIIAAAVIVIGIVAAIFWLKGPSAEQLAEQVRQNSIRMADSIMVEKIAKDSIARVAADIEQRRKDSISLVQKAIDNKEQNIKSSIKGNESTAKKDNSVKTVPSVKSKTGTFTDDRDGKTYKWVQIGNQTWMAENLAYKPKSGNYWAYKNNESHLDEYGYLYDWNTAKKVAPSGWHLPTKDEWETFYSILGGDPAIVFQNMQEGGKSGFNALLSGMRSFTGYFIKIGTRTGFWSASIHINEDDESTIFGGLFQCEIDKARYKSAGSTCGYSIRLIRD